MSAPLLLLGLLVCQLPADPPAAAPASNGPDRWLADIEKFAAADRAQPPALGGVVFIGSSSIRLWDLKKSFPDRPLVNRGFGGSEMADLVAYVDRIVVPYRPRTVVVYSGDNDIAGGKSPAQIVGDFQSLVKKIHDALPEARIVLVSIKPSKARWKLVEPMREANAWMQSVVASDKRLAYADVHRAMLDAEGQLREELFQKDGLHLNEAGYRLWSSIVGPLLDPADGGGQ